ncbi:MAG: hypothetical protein IJE04_04625 [Bacilli bacterium]|nr:hypothetical protein [Bacilli bacterium]
MKTFLEYIMLNYTWFLGGAIIILLAIIGSYADKTNFGQGKTKEDESEKIRELQIEKLKLQQQLEQAQRIKDESNAVQGNQAVSKVDNQVEAVKDGVLDMQQPSKIRKTIKKEEPTLESYEEKYAKFDKAFDVLLPKKGFDDGDLLDEIESISLDRTQKIDITEIPDLDDVDLPKIKSLDPIDEDIWKF